MKIFDKLFTVPAHLNDTPYQTSLNRQLRSKNGTFDQRRIESQHYIRFDSPEQTMQKINSQFKKLFPILFPRTRYRGISGISDEEFNRLKGTNIGAIINDSGFGYYSKSKRQPYLLAKSQNNGVFIKLKIPMFSQVSRLNAYQFGYGETLTKAGEQFKILNKTIDKNGILRLVLKLVR